MVALHAAWLAGLWFIAHDRPVDEILLGAFIVVQVARLWTLASLGARWTTRVIVLPGAPMVTRGPYRWLRHPNYWIVAAEIALVPAALGLTLYAAAFTALNAALLVHRVRVEERALAWAAGRGSLGGTQPAPMAILPSRNEGYS
jgi:methyltransferase